jgi:hypothetical protein
MGFDKSKRSINVSFFQFFSRRNLISAYSTNTKLHTSELRDANASSLTSQNIQHGFVDCKYNPVTDWKENIGGGTLCCSLDCGTSKRIQITQLPVLAEWGGSHIEFLPSAHYHHRLLLLQAEYICCVGAVCSYRTNCCSLLSTFWSSHLMDFDRPSDTEMTVTARRIKRDVMSH